MHQLRHWHRHPAILPGILATYLLAASLLPSLWHTPILVAVVVVAARSWDAWGGLLAVLPAGLAMFLGLRATYPGDLLAEPVMVAGYGLVWLSMLVLALTAGRSVRLSRALSSTSADLKQAQERLMALHHIALSLSTTLDVPKLLETIVEQLSHLWGYDHAALILVDENSGDLIVAAARDYQVEVGQRIPVSQGICGAVVQNGRAVCVGDVTTDPRYLLGVQGARSNLAVPLFWEGRILGALNVESPNPNAYGPNDVALLATVAEQAAAAIGNARLHQKTHQMAITDPHTGLYNYRHFQEQLGIAVRDAQITGGHCSLIMLDLDHFKRCNDTYGHPTGDYILEQMARVLKESCRAHDMVFRYGGEEFAVLMPGGSMESALLLAERIRERTERHQFTTGTGRPLDFRLTVSLGVASYPEDGLTSVDLLLAADKASYQAKQNGRNRIVAAHQPDSRADRDGRTELERRPDPDRWLDADKRPL